MTTNLPPGQSGQRVAVRQATLALAAAATLLLLAACAAQPSASAHMHAAQAHAQLKQAAHRDSGHPVVIATQLPADPQPSATPQPSAPPAASAGQYTGPHFATPEAAMRFLAQAFNRHDDVALHAVTTPDAYKALQTMRAGAVNLRFRSCVSDGSAGDYTCYFRHDYPRRLHQSGHGEMQVTAAPANNPGWYMYTLDDCG